MKISIEEEIVLSHLALFTALLMFDIIYNSIISTVSNDLYILQEINV